MIVSKVELGMDFSIWLNLFFFCEYLSCSHALSLIELANHMRENFLKRIQIVSPYVPVNCSRFNNGMENHLSILWFVPLGMNSFSMQSHSPRFLYNIPNWVGDIVIDMTNNIDEYDENFKERIEEPAVGHVST